MLAPLAIAPKLPSFSELILLIANEVPTYGAQYPAQHFQPGLATTYGARSPDSVTNAPHHAPNLEVKAPSAAYGTPMSYFSARPGSQPLAPLSGLSTPPSDGNILPLHVGPPLLRPTPTLPEIKQRDQSLPIVPAQESVLQVATPQEPVEVTPKRKHTCKSCGRSFTTLGHLARHNRTHTGERKHVCPWPLCEARFARQDNCMQHYKIHTYGKNKRRRKRTV